MRACRRAVVLARGLGTRMRADEGAPLDRGQAAAADAGLKAMMPFGRPFLDHVLHALAEAGIEDAALVIGPEHESIRTYYGALRTARLSIAFVTQREPLGTAAAVGAAETWAGTEPFLALNADNLYPVAALTRMTAGTAPALAGFARDSLDLPLDRVGAFALAECDEAGRLSRIVEKPGEDAVAAAGPRALVSMNLWRFDARIFAACREVPMSPRGERELPHAVMLALGRGVPFEVIEVTGPVLDLSRRTDVAAVARRLGGRVVSL